MAKFINKVEPTKASYVFEFTQDEVDVLAGLVLDLSDPVRKIVMDYTMDESQVVPTARGLEILKSLAEALDSTSHGLLDYDYFDYWTEI